MRWWGIRSELSLSALAIAVTVLLLSGTVFASTQDTTTDTSPELPETSLVDSGDQDNVTNTTPELQESSLAELGDQDNITDPGLPISGEENDSGITWGVNLNGLDSGRHIITAHGRYGSGYISPTTAELDYFASKGMTVIRLPFNWERVQHSLYGELDPVDIGYIDNVVNAAAERGMRVILDPHNFGRYRNLATGEIYTIGTEKLPSAAFADFWQKMADHYKGNPGVYGYGLMNEPHDMPNGNDGWANSCQLAIDAIREVDTATTIIVPGNHWSNASYWKSESYMLKDLVDPYDNLLFEAHEYLDADQSGTYQSKPENVSLDIGANRYAPFIEWLRANGKKGIVGEIGVVSGQGWLDRFDRTLEYLSGCDDVIVSIEYWAAGPWWGRYPLSIEPNRDGSDKPQMDIIEKYIK